MQTLIIDDDPFFLKVTSHQLTSLGVENITCFTDPAVGLAQLRQDPAAVRLVFCDLQMPGVDGIQIVQNLAKIGFLGTLVLVSGEDVRILRAAQELCVALRLNVGAALTKPVTLEHLRSVLVTAHGLSKQSVRKPRRLYGPADIRQALAEHEFVLHVQPQVSFADQRLVGVEALVRWQHPTDGLIFPDQFIAATEAGGLMDGLTTEMIKLSLDSCATWQKAGVKTRISVNISMDNLVGPGLTDLVQAELRRTGVQPELLMLEVTESRVMQNRVSALDELTRLRLRHVGLSIDDFGTGHSSMAQLRDLPFTEIKIDRSFVHGAAHDSARASICAASLMLARQLGLVVVAEGIEDQADWDHMHSLGAEVAQGYFIAKPFPAVVLPSWIDVWNKRIAKAQEVD